MDAMLELDVPLAWLSRRVRSVPGVHRVIRRLREHYARAYRSSPRRWTTIDDYEHDLSFRLNRASHMGSAIYWDGQYSINEIEVLRRRLTPDAIFVDGGAHGGEFTLVGARHATRGRVLAFEPMPAVFELLTANIALNRLKNVHAYPLGLSDERGEIELFVGEPSPGKAFEDDIVATQFSGYGRSCAAAKALCVPLDEIAGELKLHRLDIIKLDIEGGEVRALRGSAECIHKFRPALILEVAAPLLEAAGSSMNELFDELDRHGYRASLITDYRLRDALLARAWLRYGRLVEVTRLTAPPFCNLLCEPRRSP